MGERETHPSSMFEFFRSGLNALLVGNGGGAMNLVQLNVTVSQLRESSIIGVQWQCE